jgi:spermidine/putrescine transport system ATP-binding protein
VTAHWSPEHAFLLHREPGEGDRTTPELDTPDAVGAVS